MTSDIIPRWLPVVGLEDFYEVSDIGLVKSKGRKINVESCLMKNGVFRPAHVRSYPRKIMVQKIDRYGYNHVHLRVSEIGINFTPTVHKLVAQAFIGRCPNVKNQINHKDSDKTNNHPDNLEWCNGSENQSHSYANGTHTLNLHRCPKTGRVKPKKTQHRKEAVWKSKEMEPDKGLRTRN